ncbi:MAG TPA: hypothetical protein VIR57_01190 [Chloroflexota bacterium]
MKTHVRLLLLAGSLLVPLATVAPAYADSQSPTTPTAASVGSVAQGSIHGKGALSLAGGDGTAEFGIIAKGEAGK